MSVPAGGTIGIVGGGQLGRMLAIAAAQLGYRCHIYAPGDNSCAADVAARFTCGAFDDEAALAAFGREVDVATYEFENIPAGPLSALAEAVPLYPAPRALAIAQDRMAEKEFVGSLGGRPAPFVAVETLSRLEAAIARIGAPAILKTRRLGYDGKGQARIGSVAEAAAAWTTVGGRPSVLEALVEFEAEFSVILCRGRDGEQRHWDVPRNVHVDGILERSLLPAGEIVAAQADEARRLAGKVADALDYVGVLTLEFFAGADGPVFNEMAPRVHNSGHWTIEGAATSQFENHIRAICGLPLGPTTTRPGAIAMTNLIGGRNYSGESARELLAADPGAHLHLYGKGEPRPARKMGHLTVLG